MPLAKPIRNHRLAQRNPLPHGRGLFGSVSFARGFSIVELLVVISIIVVLAGILLVALGKAQEAGKRTDTLSTMTAFRAACEDFQLRFGQYPGVIPESILAATIPCPISTTENALLHLLGGYRVLTPHSNAKEQQEYNTYKADHPGGLTIAFGNTGYELYFSPDDFGKGPYIEGKHYPPFLAIDELNVRDTQGIQVGEDTGIAIPDLIDAWGQPIIYLRHLRKNGPLVGELTGLSADEPRPQFSLAGTQAYLESMELGEMGLDQVYVDPDNRLGSILTNSTEDIRNANLAQILRNPGIGGPTSGMGSAQAMQAIQEGTPRGAFVLISAGPDGIFFSASDGPGAPADNAQVDDLTISPYFNAKVISEYDDVLHFGGG